jgi:hypothetical protein
MHKIDLLKYAAQVAEAVPSVKAFLSDRTRFVLAKPEAYKSYDYFLSNIERIVRTLYNGQIGGEFIDLMANLISGQLLDAYEKAYKDEGYADELPAYLYNAYQDDVLKQYEHVDRFFRDIINARLDGKPIEPLLARAKMWANRWNESYANALRVLALENGQNMIWNYGEAEHCDTCRDLNGIVASAKEWQISGLKPQGEMLDCHGYNCKCECVPTKKRRSPKALDTLITIAMNRK